MTPLERVEALYDSLLAHYGEGEDREIRASVKLLLVALDRLKRHAGPNWRQLVNEYLEIAANDPDKFELIISKNRTPQEDPPLS
mgnify:FL=1